MPGEKFDQYGNILNGTATYSNSGISSENLKNASFTSGVQVMLGGGLMLSKNVGVELNAFTSLAATKNTETVAGKTSSSGQVYDYMAQRQAKNTLVLSPAIVVQTAADRWNVYMRTGLALPLYTGITMHETYFYQSGNTYEYNWDIKNYFSVGFNSAAGAKVSLGSGVTLWSELNMMVLNISRKERDLNDVIVNGKDYPLSQVPVTKADHYNKGGVYGSTGEQPALSQPFSNFGINVGITCTMAGGSK
jgi:hypothetical protein